MPTMGTRKVIRRTVILHSEEDGLLRKLRSLYDGRSETKITLADAVRIAIKDAARHRKLIPATPSEAPKAGDS
jgi:hypothetical protein